MPDNKMMIAALLRERAGLEVRGQSDRVEQVDEQLGFLGYKSSESKGAAKTEARKQAPQGRTTKPQQTGDKTDG
jgi:hypothetical protein